jgi:hypothetical protein
MRGARNYLSLSAAVVLSLVPSPPPLASRGANLYEWAAVAPVIVAGTSLGDNGRYHEITVERSLRGAGELLGSRVRVNLRDANRDRDRELHRFALKLTRGESYLFLLEPRQVKKSSALPAFDLVRGLDGVRELPAEGREALLAAVERFVGVQGLGDDRLVWDRLGSMLEETHPLVVQTALDQFLKFRRGEIEHLPSLRPLLDHPSHQLRERTARLIGQIVVSEPDDELPDASLLRNELLARARRDGNVTVRLAATEALGGFEDDSVVEILEEIAERDPDQDVRYAAEKMIYERMRARPERGATAREGRRN